MTDPIIEIVIQRTKDAMVATMDAAEYNAIDFDALLADRDLVADLNGYRRKALVETWEPLQNIVDDHQNVLELTHGIEAAEVQGVLAGPKATGLSGKALRTALFILSDALRKLKGVFGRAAESALGDLTKVQRVLLDEVLRTPLDEAIILGYRIQAYMLERDAGDGDSLLEARWRWQEIGNSLQSWRTTAGTNPHKDESVADALASGNETDALLHFLDAYTKAGDVQDKYRTMPVELQAPPKTLETPAGVADWLFAANSGTLTVERFLASWKNTKAGLMALQQLLTRDAADCGVGEDRRACNYTGDDFPVGWCLDGDDASLLVPSRAYYFGSLHARRDRMAHAQNAIVAEIQATEDDEGVSEAAHIYNMILLDATTNQIADLTVLINKDSDSWGLIRASITPRDAYIPLETLSAWANARVQLATSDFEKLYSIRYTPRTPKGNQKDPPFVSLEDRVARDKGSTDAYLTDTDRVGRNRYVYLSTWDEISYPWEYNSTDSTYNLRAVVVDPDERIFRLEHTGDSMSTGMIVQVNEIEIQGGHKLLGAGAEAVGPNTFKLLPTIEATHYWQDSADNDFLIRGAGLVEGDKLTATGEVWRYKSTWVKQWREPDDSLTVIRDFKPLPIRFVRMGSSVQLLVREEKKVPENGFMEAVCADFLCTEAEFWTWNPELVAKKKKVEAAGKPFDLGGRTVYGWRLIPASVAKTASHWRGYDLLKNGVSDRIRLLLGYLNNDYEAFRPSALVTNAELARVHGPSWQVKPWAEGPGVTGMPGPPGAVVAAGALPPPWTLADIAPHKASKQVATAEEKKLSLAITAWIARRRDARRGLYTKLFESSFRKWISREGERNRKNEERRVRLLGGLRNQDDEEVEAAVAEIPPLAEMRPMQLQVTTEFNRRWRGFRARPYSEDPFCLVRWAQGMEDHDPGEDTYHCPYPFQWRGARRARWEDGTLLAYEVGVGKTLTAGALIGLLRQIGKAERTLVSVPGSLMLNWFRSLRFYYPDYRIKVLGREIRQKANMKSKTMQRLVRARAKEIMPRAPQAVLDSFAALDKLNLVIYDAEALEDETVPEKDRKKLAVIERRKSGKKKRAALPTNIHVPFTYSGTDPVTGKRTSPSVPMTLLDHMEAWASAQAEKDVEAHAPPDMVKSGKAEEDDSNITTRLRAWKRFADGEYDVMIVTHKVMEDLPLRRETIDAHTRRDRGIRRYMENAIVAGEASLFALVGKLAEDLERAEKLSEIDIPTDNAGNPLYPSVQAYVEALVARVYDPEDETRMRHVYAEAADKLVTTRKPNPVTAAQWRALLGGPEFAYLVDSKGTEVYIPPKAMNAMVTAKLHGTIHDRTNTAGEALIGYANVTFTQGMIQLGGDPYSSNTFTRGVVPGYREEKRKVRGAYNPKVFEIDTTMLHTGTAGGVDTLNGEEMAQEVATYINGNTGMISAFKSAGYVLPFSVKLSRPIRNFRDENARRFSKDSASNAANLFSKEPAEPPELDGKPMFWEDVGVDLLVVDEAHNFKGVFSAKTRGSSGGGKVANLSTQGESGRGWQLDYRAAEIKNREGCILPLTATPAKSSPLDVYNILRFLRPVGQRDSNIFEGYGIYDAEQFISKFIKIQQQLLVTPRLQVQRVMGAKDVVVELFRRLFEQTVDYFAVDDSPELGGEQILGGRGSYVTGGHVFDTRIDLTGYEIGSEHRLRVKTGPARGHYSIEEVLADEPTKIRVMQRFSEAEAPEDTRFQIHAQGKVPMAAPPEDVVVPMDEFQADRYADYQKNMAMQITSKGSDGDIVSSGNELMKMARVSIHAGLDVVETTLGVGAELFPFDDPKEVTRAASAAAAELSDEMELISDAESEKKAGRYTKYLEASLPIDPEMTPITDTMQPFAYSGGSNTLRTGVASGYVWGAKLYSIADSVVGGCGSNPRFAPDAPGILASRECGHLVFADNLGVHAMLVVVLGDLYARGRAAIRDMSAMIAAGDSFSFVVSSVRAWDLPPWTARTAILAAYGNAGKRVNMDDIGEIAAGRAVEVYPTRTVGTVSVPFTRKPQPRKRYDPADWIEGVSRILVFNGEMGSSEDRQGSADGFTGELGADGKIEQDKVKYDVLIANKVAYEGMDLQLRTCALHHGDIPWEPASFNQRNGRGVRQGNIFDKVSIRTYLAEGSVDYYRLQRLLGRSSWLEEMIAEPARGQVSMGSLSEKEMEDLMIEAVRPEDRPVVGPIVHDQTEALREELRLQNMEELIEMVQKASLAYDMVRRGTTLLGQNSERVEETRGQGEGARGDIINLGSKNTYDHADACTAAIREGRRVYVSSAGGFPLIENTVYASENRALYWVGKISGKRVGVILNPGSTYTAWLVAQADSLTDKITKSEVTKFMPAKAEMQVGASEVPLQLKAWSRSPETEDKTPAAYSNYVYVHNHRPELSLNIDIRADTWSWLGFAPDEFIEWSDWDELEGLMADNLFKKIGWQDRGKRYDASLVVPFEYYREEPAGSGNVVARLRLMTVRHASSSSIDQDDEDAMLAAWRADKPWPVRKDVEKLTELVGEAFPQNTPQTTGMTAKQWEKAWPASMTKKQRAQAEIEAKALAAAGGPKLAIPEMPKGKKRKAGEIKTAEVADFNAKKWAEVVSKAQQIGAIPPDSLAEVMIATQTAQRPHPFTAEDTPANPDEALDEKLTGIGAYPTDYLSEDERRTFISESLVTGSVPKVIPPTWAGYFRFVSLLPTNLGMTGVSRDAYKKCMALWFRAYNGGKTLDDWLGIGGTTEVERAEAVRQKARLKEKQEKIGGSVFGESRVERWQREAREKQREFWDISGKTKK